MKKTLLLIALAASLPAFAAAPMAAPKSAPKTEAAKPAIAGELAQKREQRRADIEYWLTRYDGSELKSGQYHCAKPRFPDVSKQNEEIQAIGYKMDKWRACYNAFADHLNKMPEGARRIPKDVLDLMTPEEVTKAGQHITEVQSQVAADASIDAKMILADFGAWRSATEAYVDQHNQVVKSAEANDRPDLEARRNNYAPPEK